MKQLKLPYAHDACGMLVHIEHATKNARYYCPECKEELLLKIGHIPYGEKYHRPNHFSHRGGGDNHCSETFLHKQFKQSVVSLIEDRISEQQNFVFKWQCKKCGETHEGDLLLHAAKIVVEPSLKECQPDVAILDNADNIIVVIEVVVTHAPEDRVMRYYAERGVVCLQLKVKSFDDLDKIEEKLQNPDEVNVCYNPVCPECGAIMNTNGHRQTMKCTGKDIEFIHNQFSVIDSKGDGCRWFRCYKCEEREFRSTRPRKISISTSYLNDPPQILYDEETDRQYKILAKLQSNSQICPNCGKIMKFRSVSKKMWYKCVGCGHMDHIPWPFNE